ncbi:hypothetical protein EFK68_02655 [Pseudomonas aeruginosa]|uniref:hypothetical protein n=1 Tax=Pseudomonas aeruginosa TaxID=287 RepID=UPI000F6AA210|nr:hypothetical protein [Pseudomonas aeruginosa]MDS9914979.1 hypothetical protein [Pseudomonas aeruginosa]RNF58311.1 hypothetical protein EFK68_02655 [Pseudomonas aeruginosa]
MELKIVEIRDLDAEHEVGGQDLPFEVTVRVENGTVDEALESLRSSEYRGLGLFNLERGESPRTVSFLSFSFEKDILRRFGIEPEKTAYEKAHELYYRSKYVRTVGELRAAIADLPDDFPLVQTSRRVESTGEVTSFNCRGVHAICHEWIAEGPGESGHDAKWSLRLSGFDPHSWSKITTGTWKDSGPGES